jgi:hypothetical protein
MTVIEKIALIKMHVESGDSVFVAKRKVLGTDANNKRDVITHPDYLEVLNGYMRSKGFKGYELRKGILVRKK